MASVASAITKEIKDVKQHPEKYKTYSSTEEMFEDVLKEK